MWINGREQLHLAVVFSTITGVFDASVEIIHIFKYYDIFVV